jgi:hypothetical protein
VGAEGTESDADQGVEASDEDEEFHGYSFISAVKIVQGLCPQNAKNHRQT